MEITDVRVHPLRVELERPSWNAHDRKTDARLTIVEVDTDAGITGIGEIQSGPQDLVRSYVERFGEVIEGRDPRATEEIWSTLFSLTRPRPGGLGGWDGLPAPLPRNHRSQIMAAIGGIDIALWDVRGKAADLPVFRLLGGERTEVFTYATGGYYVEGEGPAYHAREFAGYVDDGYEAVKTKTGALSIDDEVERIAAIRDAIGPDVPLMLDMNATYDVAGCLEFAEAVEPLDIHWLEEPLHWHLQPTDMARLARDSPIPIAHGEREWHRFTVRDYIDAGAIGYVQFDSTRRAGFTESLRIARYAEQHGVAIAPHSAPHFHAHLVSAFGDAAFAAESHGAVERHPIQHRIYDGGTSLRDGMLRLPESPGFGLTLDRDALAELRIE